MQLISLVVIVGAVILLRELGRTIRTWMRQRGLTEQAVRAVEMGQPIPALAEDTEHRSTDWEDVATTIGLWAVMVAAIAFQ